MPLRRNAATFSHQRSFSPPEVARMSRYIGLLVVVVAALLVVNFTSDVLYARAIASQVDDADEPASAVAAAPERLPLRGLIQVATRRAPATSAVETAQIRGGEWASMQR
jgi:hypothetical protein